MDFKEILEYKIIQIGDYSLILYHVLFVIVVFIITALILWIVKKVFDRLVLKKVFDRLVLKKVFDIGKKHAKAKEVTISIKMINGNISMEITDDGIGITDKQVNDSESFGLLNIKERVLEHKGKIKISGKPGKGTRVEINVPVRMKRKM